MKKVLAFPVIVGMAIGPLPIPQSAIMAGTGVAAFVMASSLGGCGNNPGAGTIDPGTPDLGDLVRRITLGGCQLEPVAFTIAQLIVALALPAALPIEQKAQLIADAFCAQIRQIRAAQAQGLRAAPVPTFDQHGVPVINYGVVLINGKPVTIQAYAK